MTDTTTVASSGLATDETGRLISSDKVEGTPVYNPKGERLGKVHHLMIDKYTGQVAYAVMAFGGFLGIGEKYHPLPWKMLTYDTRLGGYVVDLDRSKLENAPSYASTEAPDWSDRSYTARIDEYWLVIYRREGPRGWWPPRPAARFPQIRVAATYRRFPACLLFLGGVGRCRLPLQEMTEGADRAQTSAKHL